MATQKKLLFPQLHGHNFLVNTPNGRRKYLNLDNAATTPTFKIILDKISDYLKTYGSIHRGSGQKSKISTCIFEETIQVVLNFLGVKDKDYGVVFTFNTTHAINKLSRMMDFTADDTIILSEYEHSANDIPWRRGPKIVRVTANDVGSFDMDIFEDILKNAQKGQGKLLVALSGASNVTGALTPIYDIAKLAHAYKAYVMVDAAQLVAHREINLNPGMSGAHIDFITFSGHKMYAPFGSGVLVGRRELLNKMIFDDLGGGNIAFATNDIYDLAKDLFKRSTAGTPNAVGAIAMALSCKILKDKIGFYNIKAHEQEILNRARKVFAAKPEIQTFCDLDFEADKKCSVLAFSVKEVHPSLVAARLAYEFGIGVRHGPLCQYSYVAKLLRLSEREINKARKAAVSGNIKGVFGIVRASFGLENDAKDVDRIADALQVIIDTPKKSKEYSLNFRGEYVHKNYQAVDTRGFFNF